MTPRALAASAAGLAIPVAVSIGLPAVGEAELLWLLALVPVFFVGYHRGWSAAAVALALGFGLLIVTEAASALGGRPVDDWPLLLSVAAAYLIIGAAVGWTAELLHRERDRAERLALTDPLTGIPNRRYARAVLDQEFAAAQRGRPLALVLLDLDGFKKYNDAYGHGAGDEALRVFAAALAQTTRQMNLSARYGGEEFISILSDTNTDGALIFVERVRRCLAATSIPAGRLTFSAGIAAFTPGMRQAEDLVAAADAALYRAKERGRDRAEVFADLHGAALG